MLSFTVGLLLASLVSGLPAPRAEADPEPVPMPEALPEPVPEPEADPEADPYYGIGGYGLGGFAPYGGVVEEVLPPIFIEGCVEEIVVPAEFVEYPGIHAFRG